MTAPVVACSLAAGAILDLCNLAGGKCTLEGDDADEYPSFPPGKGATFREVLQRQRVVQAETNDFLERSVAIPLSQGLTAVALKQPHDPIDYLVKWLRRYAEHEGRKEEQTIKKAQLLKDRAELKARRDEELRIEADRAANYDSLYLTKEDKTVLNALERTTWLSEEEFRRILNHLKSALGVKAAYVLQLCEEEASGPVLQYTGADSESTFLVDLTLKEGEGVVWDALPETDKPEEVQSEDSADSENDDENTDNIEKKGVDETEENNALDGEIRPQSIQPRSKIGRPLIVADVMADDRVKFWNMVRPGSLAAISVVFEDPANKANVDAVKQYLREVQNMKKLLQDKENGLKQTASEGTKKTASRGSIPSVGVQRERSALAGGADLLEAISSDEEGEHVRSQGDTEGDEEGVPAPVAPPTYTYTTMKMIFCIDTLGMDEGMSTLATTRLSHFVDAIKNHCIRTRLAAVRAQAEEGMDDEWKELAREIEKALEKLEAEAAPDIDSEKTLALERLEAKLQQEKEEREQRKAERIREVDNKKRRQHLKEHEIEKGVGLCREGSEPPKEWPPGEGKGKLSEREEREEEEHADGPREADEGLSENERRGEIVQADDEVAVGKAESRVSDDDTATELGEEDGDDDEAMEMLDPTFFLDQAEAKVRYEKICAFICQQYGNLLAEMENMFIPLTASARPILAACLLLLGEPPSSLRQNSKLPHTDWDWQKLRSRMGASFVQRLSRYRPEVPRPPPQPSTGSTADTDVALLYHIRQTVTEESGLPGETAPLIETSPALFLLEIWVKLAIDYRYKCLTVMAATLFREARRKKIPLPQLETEVDIDFQNIPLPSVLSVDA